MIIEAPPGTNEPGREQERAWSITLNYCTSKAPYDDNIVMMKRKKKKEKNDDEITTVSC